MFSKQNKVDVNILARLNQELGFFIKNHAIAIDSRKANQNTIFCAYPGTVVDGRDFITAAIANGCSIILYEEINSKISGEILERMDITLIAIANLQLYVGYLAALKHGFVADKIRNIAVTGTNGKTSISYWLNQVYTFLNKKTGLIGTLGTGIFPDITYNNMTTPDPVTLQDVLADFAYKKVDVVAMETSSHAIHQGRINGIKFKTAIFTNLTQDHLDYHLTMEKYYQAKKDLFYWQDLGNAVINIDDRYGQRLYNELVSIPDVSINESFAKSGSRIKSETTGNTSAVTPNLAEINSVENNKLIITRGGLRLISYGLAKGDVRASDIKITIAGTKFNLHYKSEAVLITVKTIGKFNVYNLLAVAAVLILDGYSLTEIQDILTHVTPVSGRMDAVIKSDKPLVVVDFSHTPDSLENALVTLKEVEHSGKLYCVFGCGGNRDKLKRPIMGEIAARLADVIIVTSDNPRNEEPNDILNDIAAGIKDKPFMKIENRSDAIKFAIDNATANDIILIAGKGHEDYQEIKGTKHHFSDLEVASELIFKHC